MFEFLSTNFKDLLEAAAYIIAGASVIVKLTPAKWDDSIVATLAKFLALNKESK